MTQVDEDQGIDGTIGGRLRAAREAKGISLDDVARQTRIPRRHLEHIEEEDWDSLPAITYSIGFARSYANAVGLDGSAVASELRQRLGGTPKRAAAAPIFYEPADPSRVPPKPLAWIAVALAVLLGIGYMIWRNSALDEPELVDSPITRADAPAAANGAAPGPNAPAPAPASGPVVLTATADVWLRIYEAQGGATLYQGTLKAGEKYEVPATANAPQIRTGRAEALKVTVGNQAIPPLGAASTTIANVSLRSADLAARLQSPPSPGLSPAPR